MARRMWMIAVLTLLAVSAVRTQSAGVPVFEVDPSWPKGLPNNWTFGEFSGVTVDSHDHIWINQRPRTLAEDEKYLLATPPIGDCCRPGPSIMEFDQAGNFVQGWGGPGQGSSGPRTSTASTWTTGTTSGSAATDPKDNHILKFSKTGYVHPADRPPGPEQGQQRHRQPEPSVEDVRQFEDERVVRLRRLRQSPRLSSSTRPPAPTSGTGAHTATGPTMRRRARSSRKVPAPSSSISCTGSGCRETTWSMSRIASTTACRRSRLTASSCAKGSSPGRRSATAWPTTSRSRRIRSSGSSMSRTARTTTSGSSIAPRCGCWATLDARDDMPDSSTIRTASRWIQGEYLRRGNAGEAGAAVSVQRCEVSRSILWKAARAAVRDPAGAA